LMIVADREHVLVLSGNGDVIQPDDGVVGIGSGGEYAVSAARALVRHTALSAKEIVEAAMAIASEICIYTNQQLTIEELS
jgi:ATP-dependent HslUV protease subunit HslV